MRCEEARERLSELEPGEAPAGELALHLESCPACTAERAFQDGIDEGARGALARSAPARLPRPVLPVRRTRWPLGLAAAGLLAAGIWAWRAGRAPAPSPLLPASASGVSPRNPFDPGEGQGIGLGANATATLRPGASALREGEALRLLSGTAELTAREAPLLALWEGYRLRLEKGSALLEVDSGSPGILLRTAEAAEPSCRVWALSGILKVERGEERLSLEAGEAARLEPGGIGKLPALPPPWRAPWTRLAGIPGEFHDASIDLGASALSGDLSWEAVVVRRHPGAALAIRIPAPGGGWRLPLGASWTGEPGRELRLGMEIRKGWVRLEAGGRRIADCPLAALQAEPASVAVPGLQVWGGSVEVREARWRPLP